MAGGLVVWAGAGKALLRAHLKLFRVAGKGASTSPGTLRAATETMWHHPVQPEPAHLPALPASTARLEGRGGQIRNRDSLVKCLKTALEIFFFSHVSSDNAPCITSDFFARPRIYWEVGPRYLQLGVLAAG